MGTAATPTRDNRPITVDLRDDAPYFPRLSDGQAWLEGGLACLMALGFQLTHQATCDGGGGLTRPSPEMRVRLRGGTIGRGQWPRCPAVCPVLPHCLGP